MTVKAYISGCAGLALSDEEIRLFAAAQPWGFILFKRNCDTPAQVAALTASLRGAVGRPEAPVLIDQEGGRVQRLAPPNWPSYPSARHFGDLFARDPAAGRRAAWLGTRLIAADLRDVGVDVDCVPCLDLPVEGAHDVIGRRAYALDPNVVIDLGRQAAEGLLAGGVVPVIKHMPGHGRAGVDSHLQLPQVDTGLAELRASDFIPFRALRAFPFAMTAHVVYTAIDPMRPATQSPTVVSDIIRGEIGFAGCLISDDLSMQALSGGIGERAAAVFAAGVDLALHCNGKMDEMIDVADHCPALDGEAARRAQAALGWRHEPDAFDRQAARAEFDDLMG